jgi:hypothetical protein
MGDMRPLKLLGLAAVFDNGGGDDDGSDFSCLRLNIPELSE